METIYYNFVHYEKNSFSTLLKELERDFIYLKKIVFKINLSFIPNKRCLDTELFFKKENKCGYYSQVYNEICIGTKFIKEAGIKIMRKFLLHEFIHACGIIHDEYSRSIQYYSSLTNDRFSESIMRLIGWEVPTTEEYEQFKEIVNQKVKNKICP